MKKFLIIFIFFLSSINLFSKPPTPHVDVFLVPPPSSINLNFKYPARVKAIKKVVIFARVSGILQKKFYKEGSFVKKGQILYQIEPDIYKAKYNLALRNLDVARAYYKKALREWKRVNALYKDKATSKKNYDNALSNFEIAKANVWKAEAEVKLAKINLNYTNVKASIDGFTQLKLTDVGTLVKPGTPLVSIIQLSPIYVEFSIPDVDYFKIRKLSRGSKIFAKLLINGKMLNEIGKINFINKEINEKTSTVKLRAIFKNKNITLIPGEFVRIKLEGIELKNVITIPIKAVIQKGEYSIVFVVDKNNIVRIRPVITGKTLKNNRIVILKGLFPGEKIVLDNFFRISPNSPVIIDKIIK